MYIDHIWPFTTFISRNKHNKNIRLRLYWLRLRVAEAEVQTSHGISCPACVWQTVPPLSTQTHTADKWQPAISRFAHTSYLNLC